LVHLWQKLYITDLSQEIHSLNQTKERVEEENKQLLVRWIQLSDPQRMERIAQSWGFSHPPPRDVAFLIISSPKADHRGTLIKFFRGESRQSPKLKKKDVR